MRIGRVGEPGITVDSEEVGRFAAESAAWWDPAGSFRALHWINPARLGFIRQELQAHFASEPSSLRPFAGLRLLDIGCGGGLTAEPMARLGFAVTGIDAGAPAIAAAQTHAEAVGLAIDYRHTDAESLVETGMRFDAVLALEVIEHVADPAAFFASVGALVRPGGAFIGATLNRTLRSFALAIVGAEFVFRWLPPSTHDWRKFLRPSEFILGLRRNGLSTVRLTGLVYDPWSGKWSLGPDLGVNYMVAAVRG
jgi:2-polyprenyl-6-hydroxyphenyl methylase/3-demethylubiquinone-9 3-methyltransferase